MMRTALLRAFFLSLLFFMAQAMSNGFTSWHLLIFIEVPVVACVFMIVWGADIRFIVLTVWMTGMLFDTWSATAFGTLTVALLITTVVCYRIFTRMLTNKSGAALVLLGISATIIYRGTVFVIYLVSLLKTPAHAYPVFLDTFALTGLQIVAQCAALMVLFGLTNMFSKRFHPHYLHNA